MSQSLKLHGESEPAKNEELLADLGESDFVIPVLAEELSIDKRLVEKGTVRLTKLVHERPEIIHEILQSERIEVQRVPRDEIVATLPTVRMEGDVTIIPVVEEILIVTKQFRVKEELHITKSLTKNEHHQEVSLRTEELVVIRLNTKENNQ